MGIKFEKIQAKRIVNNEVISEREDHSVITGTTNLENYSMISPQTQ